MIRLVDKEWGREISDALRADASELRIICPFIKKNAIERILEYRPGKIQVITRFNLADFAEGVSDIEALRELLKVGADIRGIKNLHAKIYLFGSSCAIITSANLTKAALERNHEFGLVAEDESLIKACRGYFGNLWNIPNSLIRSSFKLLVNGVNCIGAMKSYRYERRALMKLPVLSGNSGSIFPENLRKGLFV